jgi:hypothetical protein
MRPFISSFTPVTSSAVYWPIAATLHILCDSVGGGHPNGLVRYRLRGAACYQMPTEPVENIKNIISELTIVFEVLIPVDELQLLLLKLWPIV